MEEMMYKHDHSGQRSTAIGLAAGLGGGALLFALAGLWGVNKASEARAAGANQGLAGIVPGEEAQIQTASVDGAMQSLLTLFAMSAGMAIFAYSRLLFAFALLCVWESARCRFPCFFCSCSPYVGRKEKTHRCNLLNINAL